MEETAEGLGISNSDLLRRGARLVSGLGPTFDGETRAAISRMASQIRSIGVNINQAVRAMNAGLVPSNKELQDAFGQLTFLLHETREAYLSLCSDGRARALLAMSEDPRGE
ncbi:hypothetical protein GCM10007874_31300 [Labrys miyagiensis]|uniref:Plasmid mobilization relaxosome protein MobC n=2 Tax=Labrys miyagiensis TaxID=346912 RepID=A0ABQ6CIN1_9HYPH|nr:hypothetical protein GCM10007874_31300 [Labrys miyagiensis]